MRRFGITPSTATDQAQRDQQPELSEPFAALPSPTGAAPYRLNTGSFEGRTWTPGVRTLHVIGDHGGVKDPNPQLAVVKAMIADNASQPVDLCYSVGDVDYFTGEVGEIGVQFYEPYADYPVPIVAIPGNHDGAGNDKLATFMQTFCDPTPKLIPAQAEYNRDTMDQPNCYWTLTDELVTIIGLYSNVPSGGVIEMDQQEWLVEELKAAPEGVALIVALHHPPYSCDAHHGGSEKMGKLLDEAFVEAGRWPSLVLAGHVHDYQRFTRTLHEGHECAYVVCGAGGYHNLHAMATDAAPGLQATHDCVLEAFDATQYGFLRLTVTPSQIVGVYTGVSKEGVVTQHVDSFAVLVG
jgi:3',5'-cyclic AMP phosphodiesterase CpdA